jgi:hypothetical protein
MNGRSQLGQWPQGQHSHDKLLVAHQQAYLLLATVANTLLRFLSSGKASQASISPESA